MNKTYKEVMKQLAEKGVNFEDLAERLNDCHDSCSAKDIEDKLAELITHQPHFTLTAEEVEPVKKLLSNKLFELKIAINDWKYRDGEMASYIQKGIDTYQPILTRINQWQDEILKTHKDEN